MITQLLKTHFSERFDILDRELRILIYPSASALMKDFPNAFGFSVSHTTRNPRPGEVEGKDYHYVSKETFTKLVSEGAFLEHAVFSGNMYGTSRAAVEKVREIGKICILDIDVQGVRALREKIMSSPDTARVFGDAKFVFIRPPSMADLEARLRARGTETASSLARRLGAAADEIRYGEENSFDAIIVNDDLSVAVRELCELCRGWFFL